MNFEQARDVIEHAGAFHALACEYYDSLSTDNAPQRVRMLLTYLSRRHAAMSAHVAVYEREANREILDTWFQYTSDSDLADVVEPGRPERISSVEDVIEIAMRIEDRLIAVYREILDTALSDHVREYFETLLQLEEQEKHIIKRDALMMKEV